MAKTKKIKTEEISQPVSPNGNKILSQGHLISLETGLRDIENAKLKMALESQYLSNLILESKLLESKIEKQKQMVSFKSGEYEREKNKFSDLKKSIFNEYTLEGEKFGYDPLSGEIFTEGSK